jgi:hypothetical protein
MNLLPKQENQPCINHTSSVYLGMENTEVKISGTNYFVNRHGEVITYNWRNAGRRAVLKPATDKKGYRRVGLVVDGRLITRKVHRLVAKAFIKNVEDKPQVNHIDGNKANNRVENLEWVTQSENKRHSFSLGLEDNNGSNNPFAKLSEADVLRIRMDYDTKTKSTRELANEYNVHISTIRKIGNRKVWKHI